MIVTLSHAAGQVMLNRVDEFHRDKLLEHRAGYGRSQHSYVMPCIAWWQIREQIERDAYGPNGGKLNDQPKSLYTAIAAVNEAIAERVHHPALVGVAAWGVQAEVIPAWAVDNAWSPMPSGGRFALLLPMPRMYATHMITEWVADVPSPGWYEGWPFREVDSTEFIGL